MEKSYAAATQDNIVGYVHNLFKPQDPLLGEIRQRTARASVPSIHVGQMDGVASKKS